MFSCFDWRRPPFRSPKNPSISCRKSSASKPSLLELMPEGKGIWMVQNHLGPRAFWLVSWERDHSWILVFSSLLVSTIPVIRQSNRLLLLQSLWIPQPGFCWYPYEFSIQPLFCLVQSLNPIQSIVFRVIYIPMKSPKLCPSDLIAWWLRARPEGKSSSCTGWGPSSLAKSVQITIITIVYDTQIAILRWGYKPTYNWGGASCRWCSQIFNYCIASITGRCSNVHGRVCSINYTLYN